VRTKHLALRVTLNSVGTVLVVYLAMQVFGYFRDNLILGISDLSALPSTVMGFLSANVLPPMLAWEPSSTSWPARSSAPSAG
jgi:hypothetical protein